MAASWSAASLHASRLSSAQYAAGLSAGGSFATHLLMSSATRLLTGFAASAVSASSWHNSALLLAGCQSE